MSKAASEANKTDTNLALRDEKAKETSPIVKFLKGFVNFFDLKLLCDPIFVNIMVGMSLAIFAELNFSVLTPFIMADFGLNTSQSATFLSVLSIADLVFRFFAPFIGDYLKKPPRKMYMLTLFLLIISRFSKYCACLCSAYVAFIVNSRCLLELLRENKNRNLVWCIKF